MIDLKLELKNYSPIDLKSITENEAEISDHTKNSITLYNKALENLRANSEDIAIIELKKAIAMNPGFHQAMNLLGICYAYTKNNDKAKDMFERVIAEENNSIKALQYMNSIGSNDIPGVAPEDGKQRKKSGDKNNSKNMRRQLSFLDKLSESKMGLKHSAVKYLIGFIIGIVIMVLFNVFFGFLGRDPAVSTQSDINNDKTPVGKNDSNQMEVDKLKAEIEKMTNDVKQSDTALDYYKNAAKLLEIDNMVTAKKYEAAADKLLLLKAVSFNGSEKTRYTGLCSEVLSKAAWNAYVDGNNLFYARKYREALDRLNKVSTYGDQWSCMDNVLYDIGMCYAALNDSRSAVSTFQKLKASYPNSQYSYWGDFKLRELTAVP